jgi:hypothetical protein
VHQVFKIVFGDAPLDGAAAVRAVGQTVGRTCASRAVRRCAFVSPRSTTLLVALMPESVLPSRHHAQRPDDGVPCRIRRGHRVRSTQPDLGVFLSDWRRHTPWLRAASRRALRSANLRYIGTSAMRRRSDCWAILKGNPLHGARLRRGQPTVILAARTGLANYPNNYGRRPASSFVETCVHRD